jgi:hypothetical protein
MGKDRSPTRRDATTNILSRFWIPRKGLLGERSSGCVKYSGVIIPRKRQPGKERMNSRKIFLSCSLNLLNLEMRFFLRG